jgi:NAD(P)-dependent dehydrogenase (short-subunit alcohol dehydrogenase family)
MHWSADDIPDQSGRIAVVTGATGGLGYETARVLAEHGATVVLAARDDQRLEAAADRLRAFGAVTTQRVDLASLRSIRAAVDELPDRIDLLVNNAGVMQPPYALTEDGFELQLGINHLGHFALTGLMLGRLLTAPNARIVTVSSNGHRIGRINFDDLQSAHRYRRLRTYAQSKLANLLFAFELQHRLANAGAPVISVAAHPGNADTDLERHLSFAMRGMAKLVPHQSVSEGVLPLLRAATDPAVQGGEYYGPDGRGEFTGHPVRVTAHRRAYDTATQQRLWRESEQLTGVRYATGYAASSQIE